MKKVSVIVPVYNTEPFIQQCVESIASQTYPELEIILIDDGSEDKSLEICRELRSADERIRILCQEHKGVSAARNQGLEAATGKYLLFVDSDDMIHPDLIKTFVAQMEKANTDLVFCNCKEPESHEMDQAWIQLLKNNDMPQWELAEEAESEEWFYVKFLYVLWGIGGKMIRRSAIGTLRFDENLPKGEDTLFIYSLIDKGIRMAYLVQEWYLYRMHSASITHSPKTIKSIHYFDCCRMIRNSEFAKNHMAYALVWEKSMLTAMAQLFITMKENGDREGCGCIKRQAASELKHPLFRKFDFIFKIWFLTSIFGGPLYGVLRRPYILAQKIFRKENREERVDAGILTFHCSDNYGAMLQAYGLKQYLCDMGIKTEIAAYEPPFLTGRHWWFPYVPQRSGAWLGVLCGLYSGWKMNLSRKQDFFRLRSKMKEFRKKYLLNVGQKRIFFARQLRTLPYSRYLLGSDQIWNPDITCGLRNAYFGAFKNKRKEKVIAYAASLGGSALSSEYDQEFAKLLCHVDVISLREAEAVPYVKQFCEKPLEVVLDPVFLLKPEKWKRIEFLPKRSGYILLYLTEPNEELISYIKNLSRDRGLPIVELKANAGVTDESFEAERTAGPAEFLGLIHKADYVVTNSFHATAFSIIYQKQFMVFLHTNRGARLRNILRIYGLEDRLRQEGKPISIDAPIDWKEAEKRAENAKKTSKEFLMKHMRRNV